MSILIIMKKLATALPLLGFLAVSLHAQDGFCKKVDLPTDYVAVEEFNSPECDDGVNPLAKNAWRAEHVRDGITVCVLPRYEAMGAKVAELIACEHVVSEKCNPRLDGLPNAIVLRSPAECVKRKLPDDLEIRCSASAGLTNGGTGYMVSQLTSQSCPPAPGNDQPGHIHTANAWLSRKVASSSEATILAVCADDYNIGAGAFIVRRFHDNYCPVNERVAGAKEGLTGWLILVNQPASAIASHPHDFGKTVTLCEGFTKESWKPLGENWIGYQVGVTYSKLCGGQAQKPNSFKVAEGPNGLWFGAASVGCLDGSWEEEQNLPQNSFWSSADTSRKLSWNFHLNGDELKISRSDGIVSGSFHGQPGREVVWNGGISDGRPLQFFSALSISPDCKKAQLWGRSGGVLTELVSLRKLNTLPVISKKQLEKPSVPAKK